MKFQHFDALILLKSWFIGCFVFVFLPYKYWEKKMKKKQFFILIMNFFLRKL